MQGTVMWRVNKYRQSLSEFKIWEAVLLSKVTQELKWRSSTGELQSPVVEA